MVPSLKCDAEYTTVVASLNGSFAQADRLAPKVGSRPELVLHSSEKPGKPTVSVP